MGGRPLSSEVKRGRKRPARKDFTDPEFEPRNPWWPETHRVQNQPPPLEDYNAFAADKALAQYLAAFGAAWAAPDIERLGRVAGSAELFRLGFEANENPPVLHTHDRYGERIDEVRYHPAYHRLMAMAIREGLHASHWREPGEGAQVARAARYYLMAQVEAGHGCPITMTSAAIPTLRRQPELYDAWAPRILASDYDPDNAPHASKEAVTIGMAMTEKQGGSDVRQNSTRAAPVDQAGPGQAYELVGHKYFVSAPMSDAFLVLAQAPGGLSCFLVPRWRPDGSRNALQFIKLKNKMGNRSNASAESELRGALGWRVGEEGRGVATIIDMVAMTRFDCMIGSAAGMRQATAQATHHCRYRSAFGRPLAEQPLMQNVLADLALESEAALALTLRIAKALDAREEREHEALLVRIGTALGKYWICKRMTGHAAEAMECIGGMGVMEDTIMPRLLRESPVNAIWEGSGNVQCLDLLRILRKTPGAVDALMAEIGEVRGANPALDRATDALERRLGDHDQLEYRARRLMAAMALTLQAATLVRYGDPTVADAFCAARLGPDRDGHLYGALPIGIDCESILQRVLPAL